MFTSFVPYNASEEELVMEFLKKLGTKGSTNNSIVINRSLFYTNTCMRLRRAEQKNPMAAFWTGAAEVNFIKAQKKFWDLLLIWVRGNF